MMRAVLAIGLLLITSCSTQGLARRLAAGEQSADGSVAVESIHFNPSGSPNGQGAVCEIDVVNRTSGTVRRRWLAVYYTASGAELLYPKEPWEPLELAPSERRRLTHSCPFRTAKQAKVALE